jgi:hypothetical protein
MTPQQKGQELVNDFKSNVYKKAFADTDFMYDRYYGLDDVMAKQCALIAVNEIINALPPFEYGLEFVAKIEFWQEVKKEIKAL